MRLIQILKTIALLICSNTFMNVAWYGHLKFRGAWLPLAVLVSWMIALPEYAFQVPANRIGATQLSATQLKVIQEVISIAVFVVFAFFYFQEVPTWRTVAAFGLIVIAVFLVQPSGRASQGISTEGSEANQGPDRCPMQAPEAECRQTSPATTVGSRKQ